MVCIYCCSETQVVNSRHQKRVNQTWRRRRCERCKAIFTTLEQADLASALRVKSAKGYKPFSRDELFITIYDSLKHRKTALNDARGLTDTIVAKLYTHIELAMIDKQQITDMTIDVLKRFDKVAAIHYQAFHQI